MCTRQKLLESFSIHEDCNSKYKIQRYIGRGESDIVFLACHDNDCSYVLKIIGGYRSRLQQYVDEAKTLYNLGKLGLSQKWYSAFYCDRKKFNIDNLITLSNESSELIRHEFNSFAKDILLGDKIPDIFFVIVSGYIQARNLQSELFRSTTFDEKKNIYYNFSAFLDRLIQLGYIPWDTQLSNFMVDNGEIKMIDVGHMIHPWDKISHSPASEYKDKALFSFHQALSGIDRKSATTLLILDSNLTRAVRNRDQYLNIPDPDLIYKLNIGYHTLPVPRSKVGRNVDPDTVLNFITTSRMEDILSNETLSFIQSLDVSVMKGLNILITYYSLFNYAVVFSDYFLTYWNNVLRKASSLVSNFAEYIESEQDWKNDIINTLQKEKSLQSIDSFKYAVKYADNYINYLLSVCPGSFARKMSSLTFMNETKIAKDLRDVFRFDYNLSELDPYWTTVLLFHDNKWIGSVNVFQFDDRPMDLLMIGIKGSPESLIGRTCRKGETKIASKILQGVVIYAHSHDIKKLRVLSPIGSMPSILQDLGFAKIDGLTSYISDYIIDLYSDGRWKEFYPDVSITKI